MSNPNPPATAGHPSWLSLCLGCLALALTALFLSRHLTTVVGGADSSGYLGSAKLFASGQLLTPLRLPAWLAADTPAPDAMHFLPLGFTPATDRAWLAPTYPSGLPLQFALAGKLLGWDLGPRVVILGSALACLWLSYLAARLLGLGRPLAFAGAIVLGAFPVFIFSSIQPLSDTPATAWCLAALVALLRARTGSAAWALASGAAFAMAVLTRPTNLFFAPALLVLLVAHWRRLALFALGGAPGALWLAFYNHRLYGGATSSGYGPIFEAFALSYGPPTALHFARWLALLLPAALLVLPFVALFRPGERRRELFALGLGFIAIVGCYLFYEVSHEVWWCLRFILPAMPPLILAGLLGIEAIARGPAAQWPRVFRPAAALALALWALALSWHWSPELGVFLIRQQEQTYADATALARDQLPGDALVVCLAFSGALHLQTSLGTLRWDQLQPADFARYSDTARRAGRTLHALLFESEEGEAFRRCPGKWTPLARLRNVTLWRLASAP